MEGGEEGGVEGVCERGAGNEDWGRSGSGGLGGEGGCAGGWHGLGCSFEWRVEDLVEDCMVGCSGGIISARPDAGVFSYMRCFKFSSSKSDSHIHTSAVRKREQFSIVLVTW